MQTVTCLLDALLEGGGANAVRPQAAGRRPQAAGRRPQAAGRRPQAAGRRPQAAGRRPHVFPPAGGKDEGWQNPFGTAESCALSIGQASTAPSNN